MPSIILNGVRYSGVGATGANGKNVVVAKVEPIIGGNKVTFLYYDDSNAPKTSFIEVMNGEQGISIASAKIVDDNELILTLSDGNEISAGKITVDSSNLSLDNYYTKTEIDTLLANQKTDLETYIDEKVAEVVGDTVETATEDDISNLF